MSPVLRRILSPNGRAVAFVAVALAVVGTVAAYVLGDAARYHSLHTAAPVVASVPEGRIADGPRIVFRHTGVDSKYGVVAMVALDDPGGPRAFTDLACDRLDATRTGASCLQTKRGVVTRYDLLELDRHWKVTDKIALPGLPSRTRLSPDGSLVATTTFVAGHSYMQTGFSTSTEIRHVDGTSYGDLEKFHLLIDGHDSQPADRNIWGVTFVDDRTFYATVATGGRTYLVRGDLPSRTLRTLRTNAECPSVSPDGTRIAYKVRAPGSGLPHWSIGVLDLVTNHEQVLRRETASVDDQVEWLDDDTLLYGLAREHEAGVTDVWRIDARANARPHLLIEQAWSPAVVRR
ncbi:hypothetical protein FB382_002915 [Nocardioides ginsengisegetis]|uniref:WD40-like Beta Propeller Repeat n=1 Tax=Nocardioides ginsengisegetis TaxID=661491 RepID=A0A7W3J1W1_9ACTN|nr:PD40 domain-containing protein [Nocardioides ginsengisegetis]MBA8804624.1 hypothetical protein [Nocardioides ginsengisegetis]